MSILDDIKISVIVQHPRPPLVVFPRDLIWRAVEGLDLKRFPLPITVQSMAARTPGSYYERCVAVRVAMKVRLRDVPLDEPYHPTHFADISLERLFREDDIDRMGAEHLVYEMVRDGVLHELDECWIVNGERVRDPHRGEQSGRPCIRHGTTGCACP